MRQFVSLNSPKEPHFTPKSNTFKPLNLKNHRPSWFLGELFTRSLQKRHSVKGTLKVVSHVETPLNYKKPYYCDEDSEALPYVQTLRKFPKKNLHEKVVLVRFDYSLLLADEEPDHRITRSSSESIFTIKYLNKSGARIILVSDWKVEKDLKQLGSDSIADSLTTLLRIKVVPVRGISLAGISKEKCFESSDIVLLDSLSGLREEVSNCPEFSEALSSFVDIFVNESFSRSHKILSSNVGVTRFCYASLAGFHFEQSLNRLRNVKRTEIKPYVALIGGGKIIGKALALRSLASRCDELVFLGPMAFQIMQALGLSIRPDLVERGAIKEASELVRFAQSRNVRLVYPKDFLCRNVRLPTELKIFPSHGIVDGWEPVDIGSESVDEITSLLMKCKKVFWIGPVNFQERDMNRESKLAQTIISRLSENSCDVTLVGNKLCESLMKSSISSLSLSSVSMLHSASVVWEFLKGRKLPGVEALDRAYPFDIDWKSVYLDPSKPLAVDIGSGNGLFLLGMAKKRNDLNYLGLEMNKKLVQRCLDSVQSSDFRNVHFVATNATSSFRYIVSSYPGKLDLVSIQCPNPDFNNPDNRWRMLKRPLVDAIIELLSPNGKVFLQSDVEAVSLRMKDEFLRFGEGKLVIMSQGWLEENPFGVRSDWERHVLDRGSSMYRLMLSKLEISETSL